MTRLSNTVKISALVAVLVLVTMGMIPATGQAESVVSAGEEFCPTSTEDSCGVNPETGTYFRKQEQQLQ